MVQLQGCYTGAIFSPGECEQLKTFVISVVAVMLVNFHSVLMLAIQLMQTDSVCELCKCDAMAALQNVLALCWCKLQKVFTCNLKGRCCSFNIYIYLWTCFVFVEGFHCVETCFVFFYFLGCELFGVLCGVWQLFFFVFLLSSVKVVYIFFPPGFLVVVLVARCSVFSCCKFCVFLYIVL